MNFCWKNQIITSVSHFPDIEIFNGLNICKRVDDWLMLWAENEEAHPEGAAPGNKKSKKLDNDHVLDTSEVCNKFIYILETFNWWSLIKETHFQNFVLLGNPRWTELTRIFLKS